jgi:CheY-like chemotaxis protein
MTVEPSTLAAPARGLRILIVEDESLVSLFLQGVLQDLGHSVSGVAPSLRTALAIAAGTPSDLAIVDIGLAGDGGDGIDAAIALRTRYNIPALLMTGASFDDVGPRLNDAQPVGFLTKPYTEGEVATALQTALQRMSLKV